MRTITDHVVEGDTAPQLSITVLDEPSHGGACHSYRIEWKNEKSTSVSAFESLTIHFQEGPIKEFGANGITQEVLLAILMDRLRGFQEGPFACYDNEEALAFIGTALLLLQRRTQARIARGVEGTNRL